MTFFFDVFLDKTRDDDDDDERRKSINKNFSFFSLFRRKRIFFSIKKINQQK